MINYVKAVLYAYPLLGEMSEAYDVHIKNKAVLSYRDSTPTVELAEYIVSEIIDKRKIQWLKSTLDKLLNGLNEKQKELVALRYFNKKQKTPALTKQAGQAFVARNYIKKQKRLTDKLLKMLVKEGLTKEVFDSHFAKMEIFQTIAKFLASRKSREISSSERAWLQQ